MIMREGADLQDEGTTFWGSVIDIHSEEWKRRVTEITMDLLEDYLKVAEERGCNLEISIKVVPVKDRAHEDSAR